MDYKEKADAFEAYLNATENGYEREDLENGVMFAFMSAEGHPFGVTFGREGDIQGRAPLTDPGAIPDGMDEVMSAMLNQFNSQLYLCKCYRDERGMAWIAAPYHETGAYAPEALFGVVRTMTRQVAPLSEAIERFLSAVKGGQANA